MCELCGGPAVWTILEDDQAYYHCMRQCSAWVQLELFERERVDSVVRGDGADETNHHDQV